jgi:hypothetical protein
LLKSEERFRDLVFTLLNSSFRNPYLFQQGYIVEHTTIMNSFRGKILVILGIALLSRSATVIAQNQTSWIGPVGVESDWDLGDLGGGEGSNWASAGIPPENFQPDRNFGVGEYGSISNSGIALIDHAISLSPTDIRLGETADTTGTLVIRDNGSITVEASSVGLGELRNGNAGTGTLVLRDNLGTVNLQRYTQAGNSTLVTQMSSGSSFVNSMQVSNAITLNGTLRVERAPSTSFTFTTGNSWTIMEGAPVTGNFSSVQIDPLLRSNAGQAVSVSTSGNAVTLSVEQRLVLQVDRFTGATTLVNPSGHATSIGLISYTMSSPNNGVNFTDARWHSFDDDPNKPDWFEANPSSTNLSELNPFSSLTLNSGSSHDFGTPINANVAAPLGTSRVNVGDVTMGYQLPNGTFVDAVVEGVGRFNDLVLVVDPDTGNATIQNQSAEGVEFISYKISSVSGSLETSYDGLEGLPLADWYKANPTANNLSELNPFGSADMGVGDALELGVAWDSLSGSRDLIFRYQTTDGALRLGTVNYGDLAVVATEDADFDGNGDVDGLDFLAWQRGQSPNPLSASDLALWEIQYGNESLQATATAVPEPAAGILACGILACVVGRRRW